MAARKGKAGTSDAGKRSARSRKGSSSRASNGQAKKTRTRATTRQGVRTTDAQLRTLNLTKQWATILRQIPMYDPIATAEDCVFSQELAQRALDFFPECLHHVKGTKFVQAGEPFRLTPWEEAATANIFGWVRPDGTRRYRTVFLYIPKKNGKTTWGAGVVLYVLVGDDEPGAELYSAASSRDQSSIVFQHAMGMVDADPELSNMLKIYGRHHGGQRKCIEYGAMGSSYIPLAAEVGATDGMNVHMAIVDELHRHKKRELADLIGESTDARRQPLVIYTTTADSAGESLCNEMLDYARKVRDGAVKNKEFLPIIYEPTKEEAKRWTDPEVWRKVNPSFGVTLDEKAFAAKCRQAQDRPILENTFKRLRLNIVTEQIDRWIQADKWEACSGLQKNETPMEWRLRMLDALRGYACFGGLDLGSTSDLTSFGLLFAHPERDGVYVIIPWFWMPHDGIARKDPMHKDLYAQWCREGWVWETDGDVADYDRIRTDITGVQLNGEESDTEGLVNAYGVQELLVDRVFQGAQLCSQLLSDGVPVTSMGQGFISMAAPAKYFEERVIGGMIEHGNNPVLNWMAANVTVKQDESANYRPVKPGKNSPLKIDGIVVTLMCIAGAEGLLVEDSDDEDDSIIL